MKIDKIDREIINTIVKCVASLGGQSDILGSIGSWKDSLPDEDVLTSLQDWLKEKLKQE